jgi:ABC-type transport system involved in multi-copper enzyme maturation permease subunit
MPNWNRVGVIAGVTVRELVRQRFVGGVLLVAFGMVLSALFFRQFDFGGSELKFLADFGFGVLGLFGSILAVVAMAQTFFAELETRTLHTSLAKPLRRGEWLLGKFAGVSVLLGLYTVVVGGMLGLVLAWRGEVLRGATPIPEALSADVSFGAFAALVLLQGIKFAVLASVAAFIASYARSSLFAILVAGVVFVVGHLQPVAVEAWMRSETGISRVVGPLVLRAFPNLQIFSLGDAGVIGGVFQWVDALWAAGYGVSYAAGVLTLALFSFSRREL